MEKGGIIVELPNPSKDEHEWCTACGDDNVVAVISVDTPIVFCSSCYSVFKKSVDCLDY